MAEKWWTGRERAGGVKGETMCELFGYRKKMNYTLRGMGRLLSRVLTPAFVVLVLQEGRNRCKKTSQVRDDRGLEQGGRDEHEEKWPYLGNILETEQ